MPHEPTLTTDPDAQDAQEQTVAPPESSRWRRLGQAFERFPRGPGRWVLLLVVVAVAAGGVASWLTSSDDTTLVTIRLSDVAPLLDSGEIERVAINETEGRVLLWIDGEEAEQLLEVAANRFAADNQLDPVVLPDAEQRAEDAVLVGVASFPPGYSGELTGQLLGRELVFGATELQPSSRLYDLGLRLVPLLLILLVLGWYIRSNGMVGRGSKVSSVEDVTTRFTDVAGVAEVVEELGEIVSFLHDPRRFVEAGARPAAGVLLEGPPGTGKTLLARAVAGEAGVPFFAVSGSDFVETFVGVGARRVRDLFAKARKAGQAVVFIDEIDAIGRARSGAGAHQGTDERENTLNALLVEMDGFTGSQVIVLAATNRADMLDPALTRPGRFDRRVTVPAPDRAGREAILRVHARGRSLADGADLASLARRTPGMTGADLENLINVAALEAARARRATISADDLEQALQTVALGRARTSAIVGAEDREITAWHEAGHTLAALLLEDADDPITVTIVPRGASGGTTWMSGSDRAYLTLGRAQAQLTVALAGRAAEEVLLDGDYTQGASGDLAGATDLAVRMVTSYGMTGNLAVLSADRYQAGGSAAQVDEAVEALLQTALRDAREVLRANESRLRTLVGWLLEDDTVASDRLQQLRELPARSGPAVAV